MKQIKEALKAHYPESSDLEVTRKGKGYFAGDVFLGPTLATALSNICRKKLTFKN